MKQSYVPHYRRWKAFLILIVIATSKEEILNMEALSSPPTHLEVLKLYRHLERLPLWIVSLQNLTGLVLHLSELNEGPLSSLQSFPNLMTLRLEMANVGKELCFRREHFLPFKVLYIGQLTQLNQIKIEVESMSHIQFLRLYDCPNLKNIEGIQYLTGLQHLFLEKVSRGS